MAVAFTSLGRQVEGTILPPLTPEGTHTPSPTQLPCRCCPQEGSCLLLHQVSLSGVLCAQAPQALSDHDKAGVGVSLPTVETYELMVEKDLVTAVLLPTLFLKHQSRSLYHQDKRWESQQKIALVS